MDIEEEFFLKQRGFTLLELLLVISLIAVMTMVGMSAYQLQMRNFNIDKTSLQMQQWLQAGMSYYVDCNAWPANTALLMGQQPLPSTCGAKAGQLIQYLPAGSDTDGPWNSNKYVVVTAPSSEYFEIQTTLKNLGSRKNAETIGQSIAARLPNAQANYAQLSQEENIVAQVNIPGQALDSSNLIIEGIYYLTTTNATPIKTVPIPQNCPVGLVPSVYASLGGLEPPVAPDSGSNVLFSNAAVSCSVSGSNYNVTYSAVGGSENWVSNNANIMVMTVCEKPNMGNGSCLNPASKINAVSNVSLNKF